MADYIDREAAIARFKEYALNVFGINIDIPEEYGGHSFGENFCEGLHGATDLIDDIPAADVAPVRRGRWVTACSLCGSVVVTDSRFCPNCGARMDLDGGADDATD